MERSFLTGLVILMLCVGACRKDNKCHDPANAACDNYNACHSVGPLSADFMIYENDCTAGPGSTDTTWHYYPTDTVATHCVTFTAADTTVDSLVWHVGAGVYRQRSFYLDFSQNRPASVPVTLTVYKHRNSCYPADDTVKTFTKNLYFTDTCLAYGTYVGYFDNHPGDTGTISFKHIPVNALGQGIVTGFAMAGFTPGCIDTLSPGMGNYEPFFTSFSFAAGGNSGFCVWVSGSLYYHRGDSTVVIQYIDQSRGARHFSGHKID